MGARASSRHRVVGRGEGAVVLRRVPVDRAREPEEETVVNAADDRSVLPRSKFEVWGEEMIAKEVRQSGNSGRVYLPPEWIGRHVKIIRID